MITTAAKPGRISYSTSSPDHTQIVGGSVLAPTLAAAGWDMNDPEHVAVWQAARAAGARAYRKFRAAQVSQRDTIQAAITAALIVAGQHFQAQQNQVAPDASEEAP